MYKRTFKVKRQNSKEYYDNMQRGDFVATHTTYYKAEIELELNKIIGRNYNTLKRGEFINVSLSGDLYFSCGRGRPTLQSCGQIDMDIRELKEGEWVIPTDLKRLLQIWDNWHLNDLMAGTAKQNEAIKNCDRSIEGYEEQVDYLQSIGLLKDRGYRYGTGWLVCPVPDEIIMELKNIFLKGGIRNEQRQSS